MKITEQQLRNVISESIKSVLNEGIFRKHMWYTFKVWYYDNKNKANTVNSEENLNGPFFVYYGTDHAIGAYEKAGPHPGAEQRVQILNKNLAKYSWYRELAGPFGAYEEAEKWCMDNGYTKKLQNGVDFTTEPCDPRDAHDAHDAHYGHEGHIGAEENNPISSNQGAENGELKTCTMTMEVVYAFVTPNELKSEITRQLKAKCRQMGIVPVRAKCIGERSSFFE